LSNAKEYPNPDLEIDSFLYIPSPCGRGLRGGGNLLGYFFTLTLTLSRQGRGNIEEISISVLGEYAESIQAVGL
jgi:hypothetical protein